MEDDPNVGLTMDEMEALAATGEEPPSPPEPPAPPAGPSALEAMEAALRISEEARVRAEQNLRTAPAAPAQPEAPDPLENLTDEQLQQIIDEKGPVAGYRAIQAQTLRIMQRHADARLSAMSASGLSLAEQNARAKYPTEFELFGDEIKQLVEQAPDKSALTNVANWDYLVEYVRGKNVTRYIEHIQRQAGVAAQASEAASAGAHLPSGGAAPISGGIAAGADGFYGLDAIQREIADKLGRSYKDYAHWAKKGS